MRAPVRPIRGAWPSWIERRLGRFLWDDPRTVLDPQVTAEGFQVAMSAFPVGGTFKITGRNRHAVADALLIDNVDVRDAVIVDIGASDGSTAVDLIKKLPGFKAYIMADLGLSFSAARVGKWTCFFDHEDRCVVVAGPRAIGWPTLSPLPKLLYAPLISRAQRVRPRQDLLMLNPAARALIEADSRVSAVVHDAFTPWDGITPDVIKVANLFRRLYFDDEMLRRGVQAVLTALPEGGHFLLVDNPRMKGVGPRAALYVRDDRRFRLVAQTGPTPEIGTLVLEACL